MRLVTLIALVVLFSFGWGNDCLAQSSGENVLSAALVMAPAQEETQHTRRGVLTTDMAQNRVGLRTFFAFDPTYRGGVNVASGSDQQGNDGLVTRGREGAPAQDVEQSRGTERSFFAYDPTFTGGVRTATS